MSHYTIMDNDTYEEQFLFQLDRAIEYGDPNIVSVAVRLYKSLISEKYIIMGNNIYYELINEKIENMSIDN